ncbi:hypothetical protein V8G54_019283 [Vigna mungo]|uniref:Uncharacterized protein n=1 Tax=Vigna mungo TaxID=3915 RepID=A0AAQ3NA55_VIGMU
MCQSEMFLAFVGYKKIWSRLLCQKALDHLMIHAGSIHLLSKADSPRTTVSMMQLQVLQVPFDLSCQSSHMVHFEHNQMDWAVVHSLNIDQLLELYDHQQQNVHWTVAYVSCRKKVSVCTDLHHHQQKADTAYPHFQAQHRDQQHVHRVDDMLLDKNYLNIGCRHHKIHHICCIATSSGPY